MRSRVLTEGVVSMTGTTPSPFVYTRRNRQTRLLLSTADPTATSRRQQVLVNAERDDARPRHRRRVSGTVHLSDHRKPVDSPYHDREPHLSREGRVRSWRGQVGLTHPRRR